MRSYKRIFLINLILCIFIASEAFSQNVTKRISLSHLLNEVAKGNEKIKEKRLEHEKEIIEHNIVYHKTYFPEFSASLEFERGNYLMTIPGSDAGNMKPQSTEASDYPNEYKISIGIEDYNIFSSWQDKKLLELEELRLTRTKENIEETAKQAQFKVANEYIKAYREQLSIDILITNIQMNKAIHGFLQTQLSNNNSVEVDLNSITLNIQETQRKIEQHKANQQTSFFEIESLIGKSIGANFSLDSPGESLGLTINPERVNSLVENSPTLKEIKYNLKSSILSYENEDRKRFPLPTMNLKGVMWQNTNSYYQKSYDIDTGSDPNGNVELQIGISWKIPIWGQEGFANSRNIEKAKLDIQINQSRNRAEYLELKKQINNIAMSLVQKKEAIDNLKKSINGARDIFNIRFRDYKKDKQNFLALKDALESWSSLELEMISAQYDVQSEKLNLFSRVGVSLNETGEICEKSVCL